jgi:hypothetical protein
MFFMTNARSFRKIADDLVNNAKKQGAFIPKVAVELGA